MKIFALGFLSVVLCACSIQDVAEDTRSAVKDSNDLQQKILDNLKTTQETTEALKTETEKMAAAVHLQILTTALEQMFAPLNTASLSPPARMTPFAKVFCDEATPLELIEIAHVLVTDTVDTADLPENRRLTSLVGLTLLATFTPKSKMDEILKVQAEEGGRYRGTAYVFALVRYVGVRDYRLMPLVEKAKYLGLGALEEAVELFAELKQIRDLRYRDRLVLSVPALEVEAAVDPGELKQLGIKAHRRFSRDLELTGVQAQRAKELLTHFKKGV